MWPDDLRDRWRWWRWKQRAREAVRQGRTLPCVLGGEPVVPGDFVRQSRTVGSSMAGWHYSFTLRHNLCEREPLGMGNWNGWSLRTVGPCLIPMTLETGLVQFIPVSASTPLVPASLAHHGPRAFGRLRQKRILPPRHERLRVPVSAALSEILRETRRGVSAMPDGEGL